MSNEHFVKPPSENRIACVYRVEEAELEVVYNLGRNDGTAHPHADVPVISSDLRQMLPR